MQSADHFRRPPDSTSQKPSSRVSSLPRPTLNTSFPDPGPDGHLGSQASTPDALSFYQQRPFGQSAAGGAYRQNGNIRSRSRDQALSSTKSTPAINPLSRTKTPSIKDLVAKFDQDAAKDTAQVSWKRQRTGSSAADTARPPSATASPVEPKVQHHRRSRRSSAHDQQTPTYGRPSFSASDLVGNSEDWVPNSQLSSARFQDAEIQPGPQQPLFGEVSPQGSFSAAAGYGIPDQTHRRRRSDGNMRQQHLQAGGRSASVEPMLSSASFGQAMGAANRSFESEAIEELPEPKTPRHRQSTSNSQAQSSASPQSRIPVKTSRHEAPTLKISGATEDPAPRPSTPPGQKDASQYGTKAGSSERPKTLKAVINAPPPKKSPPLRSSRPRQPVSTARSRSPSQNRERDPSEKMSPAKKRLQEVGNMDFATRRESIRRAIRQSETPEFAVGSRDFFTPPEHPNGNRAAPAYFPEQTRNVHSAGGTDDAQLPNTVYQRPAPKLQLNVTDINNDRSDEPLTGATQFEDDESPTLGVPGSFPVIEEPTANGTTASVQDAFPSEGASATDGHVPTEISGAQTRTIRSQIMDMRNQGDIGVAKILHGIENSSSTQEEAGTIQIMLSDSPALVRESQGWQDRELHRPDDSLNQNDSLTPSSLWTPTLGDGRESRLTLDSDAYSVINRVLSQYRESGIISPDMVQNFHQHLLETDPELSTRDDVDSMSIARAALEQLLYERSPSIPYKSPSEASRSGSGFFDRFPTIQNGIYQRHLDEETTPNAQHGRFESPVELDTPNKEADFAQPVKDYTTESLSANYQTSASSRDFSSRHSEYRASYYSEGNASSSGSQVLPEIQTTDGGLGFTLSHDGSHLQPTSQAPPPHLLPPTASAIRRQDISPTRSSSSHQDQSSTKSIRQSIGSDWVIEDTPATSASKPVSVKSQDDEPRRSSIELEPTVSKISTSLNPEQRELKRLVDRRNNIKELIDTEFSYSQDMKVVEDIYKATAPGLNALTDDDRRILFGNSAQVVKFSEEFIDSLKQAAAPVYTVQRKKSSWRVKRDSFSTTASAQSADQVSLNSLEVTDEDRDKRTTIGEAFNRHLALMEKVYGDYLRNHDNANQKLKKIQDVPQVRLWLNECHTYASDLTTAWDLDSLLVKPTQRLMKYPLLLKEIVNNSPENHPDKEALDSALKTVIDINHRINESKKRAELVDQVVNRQKKGKANKDFDVTLGLSKAFGRRTEKLRQQVGLSDTVEDPDYQAIAAKFGGHVFQLQVAMKDIRSYKESAEGFVKGYVQFAEAIEDMLDAGHSNSPELESKWRKFAMTVREIAAIAWTDHERAISKHCIDPMSTLLKMHHKTTGLIKKRKELILEYAKCVHEKQRGRKVDKKTQELGDQYLALNDTLKDELPKLYSMTSKLVEACLKNFVDLKIRWFGTWDKKLRPTIDESQLPIELNSIVDAFNSDNSINEPQVLALGICNGSTLAEAANFISISGVVGEESPQSTKRPSLNSGGSKSTSSVNTMRKEVSPNLPNDFSNYRNASFALPFMSPRSSSEQQRGQSSNRMRSGSGVSAGSKNTNNSTFQPPPTSAPRTKSDAAAYQLSSNNSAFFYNRSAPPPMPSYIPHQEALERRETDGNAASAQPRRPISGSTYYSAIGGSMSQQQLQQQHQPSNLSPHPNRQSGLFSSAMPMSDSPQEYPHTPTDPGAQEPREFKVLFLAASLFEFNIDRSRKQAGYPFLSYVPGEVFDVIAEKGELWLAKNQDDQMQTVGWIWEKHFAKLIGDD